MKYCTECGTEYEDDVTACADDGNTELVSLAEMHKRGLPTIEERDTRRFLRAGIAEDPLSCERFVRLLEEEKIPVFARPRRAGTVDMISASTIAPWWEIMVPEEHIDLASRTLNELRRQMDAEADEASRAAEQEAMAEGEKISP